MADRLVRLDSEKRRVSSAMWNAKPEEEGPEEFIDRIRQAAPKKKLGQILGKPYVLFVRKWLYC